LKDLDGLIARVEQATGPDQEIDAMLHVIVAERREWQVEGYVFYAKRTEAPHDVYRVGSIDPGITARNFSPSSPFPPYSYSIDAAKALKDRMLPGQAMAMGDMAFTNHPKGPWATVWTLDGSPKWNAEAATAPLAIVLATLKALQSLPEGDVR
jgi:hypothetical protein